MDIGVLKGVQVTLCGMICVYLKNKTVKIPGTHFSYNKNLEQGKSFNKQIVKIENNLKLWRLGQLPFEGRIKVFVVSKDIHLLLINELYENTIDLLHKIQKSFIWQGRNAKIKHSTLPNGYEKGGIQNVDLINRITSM